MKSFSQIREASKPKGKVVLNKKIDGITVIFTQSGSKIYASVDGDDLGEFNNKKDAMDTVKEILKDIK